MGSGNYRHIFQRALELITYPDLVMSETSDVWWARSSARQSGGQPVSPAFFHCSTLTLKLTPKDSAIYQILGYFIGDDSIEIGEDNTSSKI